MLDIELFRKNLDKIIESEKKRFKDPSIAKRVLEYDKKWRSALQDLEELRKQRNDISVKIGELKKLKDSKKAEEAIKKSKEIKEKIDELEKLRTQYLEQREKYRYMVGNTLHESVPIGETEEDNKIERTVGDLPKFDFKPLSHVDLITKIDGADLKKASEIAGSRFYYLKGDLVLLNLALLNYALEKLINKNYTPMWPPFFTKH
ncbi:MAG: serine--tRNA ligase, partial [Candidatus Lokiarchaeota archaeon]|nr:serine--tRNA ligase [Candidatus Lokiarchaeota archaeon]